MSGSGPLASRTFWNRDALIAVLAVTGIAVHLMLRLTDTGAAAQRWPLFAVVLLGGVPLVWELLRKALRRQFGSDLLAGISM